LNGPGQLITATTTTHLELRVVYMCAHKSRHNLKTITHSYISVTARQFICLILFYKLTCLGTCLLCGDINQAGSRGTPAGEIEILAPFFMEAQNITCEKENAWLNQFSERTKTKAR